MFFFVVSELRNAQINTSEYTYYRRLSEKLEMFSRILSVSAFDSCSFNCKM